MGATSTIGITPTVSATGACEAPDEGWLAPPPQAAAARQAATSNGAAATVLIPLTPSSSARVGPCGAGSRAAPILDRPVQGVTASPLPEPPFCPGRWGDLRSVPPGLGATLVRVGKTDSLARAKRIPAPGVSLPP